MFTRTRKVSNRNIISFKTEAQFSNWLKYFWLKSTGHVLVLECDVTTTNARCIKLAKFIIEQFRNEYIAKEEQEKPMKHASIILHAHRNQELTLSFNFMCGWKQITIKTLRNARNNTKLLDNSLCDIINCTYPFEKILQKELLWCLLCIKYPPNDISRSSFQVRIRTLVRKPIAQILHALERLSAIKTFFYIENDDDLLEFWQQTYKDKKIVKIDDLPDPKPDGYIAEESLYDLKFPFSLYFMKQIDNFKRHYEEEIALLQQDEDRVDRETDEWVIEDHLKDFKNNILMSIPQLRNSPLERFPELYFNDFITVIVANNGGNKNTKLLTSILKLLIGADKVCKPIFLHAYWWKNGNEVLAQLQLAQMFPTIFQNIEIQGNAIIKGSLEKYLVKEVIKLILQLICGSFDDATNSRLIYKWQYDVTKVLSFVSKVTRAKILPDLQLLCIVNDLVAAKTIPLDNIREIVQPGQSSDKHEVLSEKFINIVLDKLNELDKMRRIFTDFEEALIQSSRLNIINNCLGNLDTNMATLCCDTIEQTFFMNEELENLAAFIGPALEALYKQGVPSLQKITSLALLKESVRRMIEDDFDSAELINQINNYMNIAHPLIYFLKMYFLRDLRKRDFSIDDVRKFCEAQQKILPWLGTLNWEDIKDHRLPFNPYSKLSLFGIYFVCLHAIRASREWRHPETQSAEFVTKKLAGMNNSESVALNAVAAAEGITRYACKCGMKYVIANCGGAVTTSTCPNCKSIIGGTKYTPAAGNTRIDFEPIAQVSAKDQAGYIGEPVNLTLTHSVRSLPPTSYRILHLIVHALVGASAPQSLAFLRKNNQIATDAEKYCMDHIRSDWTVLKNILNCSDENLALLFHSLISLMTENPLPNQQIKSSADRENWETEFHRNYIAPQTRNITETATNYRMKLNAALTKNQKNDVIESEINQTLVMDKQYRVENLPALWRSIGMINFESFRAYYMSDLEKNKNNYPFLSIFFKYSKQLELLKCLLPVVKFVQILNSKLSYKITRQKAREMSFRQFIEKESNYEIFNSLKTNFDDFKLCWNAVISSIDRYQCHELPYDKPVIGNDSPVVFGLMEQKDSGIFLCAILHYLIDLQNKSLQEVIEIPPGNCKSLIFLDDFGSTTSKTKPKTPNKNCFQSMYLDRVYPANIINFEWDDGILTYSQRNLAIERGEDIMYDLAKIEAELANILLFEKGRIVTQPNSQLYLEPFPYHMELFQECMRILSDIKNLITQESIPIEKINLLEHTLDNAPEILSSLEFLLCFVKRTVINDKDISIKDYISQWLKLSSLSRHEGFSKILNIDLRLKHLVALYEFVEQQVANVKIKYIHEKYKAPLSADMKTAILESINIKQQKTTAGWLIPADAFALALKRFMFRFLSLENQKETELLYVYLQDSSLNLWPSTILENHIDELFPKNLLVANTYDAYEFTMKGIKQTSNLITNQQTGLTTNNVNRAARRFRFDAI
ncbi:hypothetical protein GLOIN_2v1577211 [Rhizophagus clarus]|uniref:RZ-type domain-containing protein n=1 Tax=Rhizophagus clarus TaxID=94130 RepID=A0A8H3QW66_9GLOM|nr:hypothetical protein GLOIN_2v1577211 [Rhizophagus clarus]